MGEPAKQRPATYADLEAVPLHLVAEIVDGVLHTFPRPASPHGAAATSLTMDLGQPFQRGRGGPGGWWFIVEPELHLGDDVLVPDLAGWRRERMPLIPTVKFFTLPPDWVCEVLSPSTATHDRLRKMPVYARAGVMWLWLLDPLAKSLEVFHLFDRKRYAQEQTFVEGEVVRASPFDAIELDLTAIWDAIAPDEG
ncbi:Uma2 family endonuclease [Chondromyces apiculatus]|uniref:Uma2 family endonuclease n=1 Tax=Chondromyces apiculatus TaxID=51 RepID=UPI0005C43C39|nr:Uma2 family endonuclease [Chondromyces apiculatus]